jgi:heme exporter protein B
MLPSLTNQIAVVFLKDLRSEFRRRVAISSILLFVFTTVVMIGFAVSGEQLQNSAVAGLWGVVMFFSAMSGLSRAFVGEEDRGTTLLLRISAPSSSIYFGKLLFNCIMSIALNLLAAVFFLLMINFKLNEEGFIAFLFAAIMSSIGFAATATILSAVISRASSRSAIFSVLSFPVLLPLILVSIETTGICLEGSATDVFMDNCLIMIAYSGIIITVSSFLFDFVWKD